MPVEEGLRDEGGDESIVDVDHNNDSLGTLSDDDHSYASAEYGSGGDSFHSVVDWQMFE